MRLPVASQGLLAMATDLFQPDARLKREANILCSDITYSHFEQTPATAEH